MVLDSRGWLDRYAAILGIPTATDEDVEALLSLAGIAAHASERTAAPVSCYLVAVSGLPVHEALAAARQLADEVTRENAQLGEPQSGDKSDDKA